MLLRNPPISLMDTVTNNGVNPALPDPEHSLSSAWFPGLMEFSRIASTKQSPTFQLSCNKCAMLEIDLKIDFYPDHPRSPGTT